jgi:transcriptional regulator with XRE-family HTH domain
MSIEEYGRFIAEAEARPEYWQAIPLMEFAEEVTRRMRQQGMNRAELARRLGTTRANVTKVLRGDRTLELSTMVRVAWALDGAVLHLHIADREALTRWFDSYVTTAPVIKDLDLAGEAAPAVEAENQSVAL